MKTFLKFFQLEKVKKVQTEALQQLSKRPLNWQSTNKAGKQGYKKVFTSIERYSPPNIRRMLANRAHICMKEAGVLPSNRAKTLKNSAYGWT